MIPDKINIEEIVDFVSTLSPETKIYIGADSERFRINDVWYADYSTIAAIHMNSKNGCRIFGCVDRVRDYQRENDRPKVRLMGEVYRVAQLYTELASVLDNEIVVHLDLNPDHRYVSNMVVNEALGYVKAMCGVTPVIKPMAWAATAAADRFKSLQLAA
jgi:predicted RNase H-related nuclease YkuK (DUF458 family)